MRDQIFESKWYILKNSKKNERQYHSIKLMLLTNLTAVNREVIILAGGVTNLTFETFMSVCIYIKMLIHAENIQNFNLFDFRL